MSWLEHASGIRLCGLMILDIRGDSMSLWLAIFPLLYEDWITDLHVVDGDLDFTWRDVLL